MLDLHSQIRQLHRPSLLVRAARFAVDDYRRNRDLPRLMDGPVPNAPGPALIDLLDIEHDQNEDRLSKSHIYSAPRHIMVLAAIMAEARDLAATRLAIVDPT